ncbi:hypothetical protein SAMN02745146_3568 [Hymenobacter daecheongensis DSM 21074]|uniref:Uncharacterized protein n=1 Tax=Hymenobacter daecheongensis DSM 21074 TaxID=1121955 RepID=A0A1M6KUD8_9BACT|nr:hypothetical protein [Hymenobacter daecheongensis]SHJ62529.1 hypothetical protein SAMN02745146_3568 [Hymenobacter daecheongensis DSM 21074]
MTNRIAVVIPAAVQQKVADALLLIRQELNPYMYPLTPEQRQSIVKMGDRSVAFMEQIEEYGTATPGFVPSFIDFEALKEDVKATADLDAILRPLLQLVADVESTQMQTGGEGYTDALVVYRNIQSAAKANIPGAQAAYDELKKRFAGQGKLKVVPAKPAPGV